MGLLVLLIVLNVWLLFLFNLFERFKVNILQAIVINYFTTLIVGSVVLGRFPIQLSTISEPYFPYSVLLGTLFISGFTMLAMTVEEFGVTLTSIAQKMSLIIPILFGIIIFKEHISWIKWIGIGCAFSSIILINLPDKKQVTKQNTSLNKWYLLFLTFFLGGIIDATLYYVERTNISPSADIGFLVTLFGTAGIIGFIMVIAGYITGKLTWNNNNLWCGIALGIPNFFTIYWLLKLINDGYSSNVLFPILNVSIITLAAIIGALVFKEKLNKKQWIGFGLGIICIILIAIST